ncbi:MAG: LPS export ABC transporter periplasmic protein LptC [Pseudomonadota bacterium]
MIKFSLILIAVIILSTLTARYLLNVEKVYMALVSDDQQQLEFTHEFEQFTLTNTDTNGVIESVIYSPQTFLDTTDQITTMDNPQIELADNEGSPVTITALQAQVFHQQNLTELEGDVKVNIMNDQNIQMSTEKLMLDHNQQLAYTELPATVIHDKGQMQGDGLEFKFDASQIKFLANVRGTYEY